MDKVYSGINIGRSVAIDAGLQEREVTGRQIRVGLIGAGSAGCAIALQLATPVSGIRLVGIANRTAAHGEQALLQAGIEEWCPVDAAGQAECAIAKGLTVLTEDASVLTHCQAIDVVVEATGSIEAAARTVLDAFQYGKDVVLVNAELDALVGPILKRKADEAGVIVTNTDGDEPGVAMTLLRYLRTLGLRPVAAGNIKGILDHYRTPETQRAFAEENGQDVKMVTSFADGTKLSIEATVLANATGFCVGQAGMYGPACNDVREIGDLLPADEMLASGLVDYALGAAPHTGAFVVVYEESLAKRKQLAYYKLGPGPFYVFHTPFHLPHAQIVSTIGRLAIHRDATIVPVGGPVCEVIAVAKCDLKAGERLDGIGGFCTYGVIHNRQTARAMEALPVGLSEGCVLVRDILRDEVVCFNDVVMAPEHRVAETLWREQSERWPTAMPGADKAAMHSAQYATKRVRGWKNPEK